MLFILTILFILFLLNRRKFTKNIKKIYFLYVTYLLSVTLYLLIPPEETLQIMPYDTYLNYLINDFQHFCSAYFDRFVYKTSYLTIPILLFWALIFFKTKKRNVLYFVLLNFVSIYFFYFAIFLLGHCALDANKYYFDHFRWTLMYVIMFAYLLLLEVGYFIDFCTKLVKKDLVKSLFCVFILFVFSKYLIIDNFHYLFTEHIPISKENRLLSYVIEKIIVNNKDNNIIILPKNFELPDGRNISLLYSEIAQYGSVSLSDYEIAMFNYFRILHYPMLEHITEIKFTDEFVVDKNLFSVEEINSLDFQKLLLHPIHKNEIIYYSNPPTWSERFTSKNCITD